MPASSKRNILFLILIAVLLLLSGVLYYMLSSVQYYYTVAIVWIFTVLILLWYGNLWIFNALDKKMPWLGRTSQRFFLQMFVSVLFSLACINITFYLFKLQTSSAPDLAQVLVLNVYGLLFIIPVLSVNFSAYFVSQWKQANRQSDELREENLRSQLNSLRMQLDPHFLFNNLNVLSSLIEKDQGTASHFLDKFADVYRYVLQYKKEDLVPLVTELDFVDAYIYLLKQRFGEQLQVSMKVPAEFSDSYYLPPLILQLLFENALKHNSIAGDQPFLIDVYVEKQALIVRNTLRPRLNAVPSAVGGTGLDSIRRRYEFLSDLNIDITINESFFIVSLPLLEID